MRAARWRNLRDDLRQAEDEIRRARAERDRELGDVRAACKRRKQQARDWCASERDRVRAAAREELARVAAWKRSAWEHYRWLREQPEPKRWQREYSAAEQDQHTLQNIPPEYHALFRELAPQIPRDTTPDNRAEIFLEWVEAHPEQTLEHFADAAEAIDLDAEFAREFGDTSFDPDEFDDEAAA